MAPAARPPTIGATGKPRCHRASAVVGLATAPIETVAPSASVAKVFFITQSPLLRIEQICTYVSTLTNVRGRHTAGMGVRQRLDCRERMRSSIKAIRELIAIMASCALFCLLPDWTDHRF